MSFAHQVVEFNQRVLNIAQRPYGLLNQAELDISIKCLHEEIDEFKEAADWRKTATDRLYAELDKQVYPDGAQIELSTGYHQVSLTNFVKAWENAMEEQEGAEFTPQVARDRGIDVE